MLQLILSFVAIVIIFGLIKWVLSKLHDWAEKNPQKILSQMINLLFGVGALAIALIVWFLIGASLLSKCSSENENEVNCDFTAEMDNRGVARNCK